jgi:hypothetical protein
MVVFCAAALHMVNQRADYCSSALPTPPQPDASLAKRLEAWQQMVPSPWCGDEFVHKSHLSYVVLVSIQQSGWHLAAASAEKAGWCGICLYL